MRRALVVQLLRIRIETEELLVRQPLLVREDELPAVRRDAADDRTHVVVPHEISEARRAARAARLLERMAFAPGAVLAEGAQNRRHDVDRGDRLADHRWGVLVRILDEQRHVEERLVERVRVTPEAVVVELLAVVGGDDDERAVEEIELAQAVEQAAELRIAVGDRAVVERDEPVVLAGGQAGAPREGPGAAGGGA